MNKVNVQHAINIMKRAGRLSMVRWQDYPSESDNYKELEVDLIACDIAACFANWVAISPEFRACGGYADVVVGRGLPVSGIYKGSDAIAHWLGIDEDLASALCYMSERYTFYPVVSADLITKQMVIDKLELILSGELS